jgi:deoxyadenosine/deoxycytidine kinase
MCVIRSIKDESNEQKSMIIMLEQRWQQLSEQIKQYEHDIDQSITDEQVQHEFEQLERVRDQYQTWLESSSSSMSLSDIQVN